MFKVIVTANPLGLRLAAETFPLHKVSSFLTLAVIAELLQDNFNAEFWSEKGNAALHTFTFVYQLRIIVTDFRVFDASTKGT